MTRAVAAETVPFVSPFHAGELLAGCYEVRALIGHGGVGFVLSALDVLSCEVVALKFLRPEFWGCEEMVRRFRVEALAYSRIRSEHAVSILAADVLDDGTPFMVMELLHGRDLERQLLSGGPLPVATAVDYALQACEGLAAAHAAGVRHFDIKPSNLFLVAQTPDAPEHIELIDFGICKGALTPPDVGCTGETLIGVGSQLYASPEQRRGDADVDVRSDIWSIGCVLYEMIAGEPAFSPGRVSSTSTSIIVDERAVGPSLACPWLPFALERVIRRCLENEPSARFADVEELAEALRAYQAMPDAVSAQPQRISAVVPLGSQRDSFFHVAARKPRSRRKFGYAVLLALAALGCSAYALDESNAVIRRELAQMRELIP
jgi:eukaryotic-like serine/threonine-protein kinase